ncbi:MAG: hypothetical protein LC795_23260 [Acidobacteria bacterium]|nr:hypothetical protein [Acidobacteriota bacterium]
MRAAKDRLLKLICATLLVGAAGGRAPAAEGGNPKTSEPATARETTNSMKVAGFDEALLTALARRGYADTVRLWNSRLLPALEYWRGQGRLTPEEADRVRALPVREQVGAVLGLERRGIYFSKDFSKSILYSVAAPGASQHLSLLAFDVSEYADARVRATLARHGWFRTVRNDHPHFTYLGLGETQLPSRGLRKLNTPDGEFWVPNSPPL